MVFLFVALRIVTGHSAYLASALVTELHHQPTLRFFSLESYKLQSIFSLDFTLTKLKELANFVGAVMGSILCFTRTLLYVQVFVNFW